MKRLFHNTVILPAALFCLVAASSCGSDNNDSNEAPTTRRERNLIKEGNNHYKRQEYAQAEVANRKALAENPSSDIARFNLASSLSHLEGERAKAESDSLFRDIAKTATNLDASQRSFYNLGNESYRGEDYAQSIEMYKDALRRNPLDDNARENLRLAQLKLQEQQQNQDQNKENNQQDQQEQEQEQEQDQQQQQQQNQQNQDQQNEDQQQQDQQNQDQQDKQQGNKRPDQKNERDKKDQKQQGGMSQSNAEQILKAMENEENATRRRVEAQQKAERDRKTTRRTVEKPW